VLLIAVIVAESSAPGQSDAELKALNQRVIELYRAGKYGEAVPFAEHYTEAMKARHGPDRPEYACPQQPGPAVGGHQPPRRGRTPDAPRALLRLVRRYLGETAQR
jgi:hypothetical protein